MKHLALITLIATALAALTGCQAPALMGLGPDGMEPVPELNGLWVTVADPDEHEKPQAITISQSDDDTHLLQFTGARLAIDIATYDIDDHIVFDMTLGNLERLVPSAMSNDGEEVDFSLLHTFVVLVHYFGVITIEGDTLSIATLSKDWLDNQIDSGATPSGAADGHVAENVLTGDSNQMRALIRRAIAEGHAAFDEPWILRRVDAAPNTATPDDE